MFFRKCGRKYDQDGVAITQNNLKIQGSNLLQNGCLEGGGAIVESLYDFNALFLTTPILSEVL